MARNPSPRDKGPGWEVGAWGETYAYGPTRVNNGLLTYSRTEAVPLRTLRCSSSTRLEEDRTRQSANVCLQRLIPAIVGSPIQRSWPHACIGLSVMKVRSVPVLTRPWGAFIGVTTGGGIVASNLARQTHPDRAYFVEPAADQFAKRHPAA